jgi:hypothetical protein
MRFLVVFLSASLTWCGLIIGLAVGIAFGTLASLSAFIISASDPEIRRTILETSERSVTHFLLHLERRKNRN